MYKHIFIYGVPGTGKTTIAKKLAERLNYTYIELDNVRKKAQFNVPKQEDPFLYEWTTEAWKQFGKLNENTAIEGFQAVRNSLNKYVLNELSEQKGSYIAEAVFINPTLFSSKDSIGNLVIVPDEKQHYSQFFVDRPRSVEEDKQFRAARYIQDYLIKESQNEHISTTVNKSNINQAIKLLIKEIEQLYRRR